jgi:hypothetical protein
VASRPISHDDALLLLLIISPIQDANLLAISFSSVSTGRFRQGEKRKLIIAIETHFV